jgi:hypothetical protein
LWPDLLRSNAGTVTIALQIDAGLQAQLELATMLDRRISLFLCLPLTTLDTFSLQKEIDNIGKR